MPGTLAPRHVVGSRRGFSPRKELYGRLQFLEPTATFRQRYRSNNLMFMTSGNPGGAGGGPALGSVNQGPHLHPTQHDATVGTRPSAICRRRRIRPFHPWSAAAGSWRCLSGTSTRWAPGRLNQLEHRRDDTLSPDAHESGIGGRQSQSSRPRSRHACKRFIPHRISRSKPTTRSTPRWAPRKYIRRRARAELSGPQARLTYRRHRRLLISTITWLPHNWFGLSSSRLLRHQSGADSRDAEPLQSSAAIAAGRRRRARESRAGARAEKRGTEREPRREAERVAGTSPSHPLA